MSARIIVALACMSAIATVLIAELGYTGVGIGFGLVENIRMDQRIAAHAVMLLILVLGPLITVARRDSMLGIGCIWLGCFAHYVLITWSYLFGTNHCLWQEWAPCAADQSAYIAAGLIGLLFSYYVFLRQLPRATTKGVFVFLLPPMLSVVVLVIVSMQVVFPSPPLIGLLVPAAVAEIVLFVLALRAFQRFSIK